ncbi:MAG: inovirus-type Gp2 protein [Thiovulaceae bacterium]|nr:inovirus-type Gp2 protein [Sulfurimonadaceae bacterium]
MSKRNKRLQSAKSYIDALSEQYSKLNIIRVEFGYTQATSKTMTLEKANEDFEHMLNNRRTKPTIFKDQVGYVCKREHGDERGIHFHAIFIYDGQKVQNDVIKGKQIGEYWKHLTNNQGTYHNCNLSDYRHKGIGMLDHRDVEKRQILDEKVINYLCKEEQDIEPIKKNNKDRAFTRGTISKTKKKLGRPRS